MICDVSETYRVKWAYLTVWSTSKRLNHTFLLKRALLPPFLGYVKEGFELVRSVYDHPAVHSATLGVQPEDELGDDTKVGSGTTDNPEEFRVLRLASR